MAWDQRRGGHAAAAGALWGGGLTGEQAAGALRPGLLSPSPQETAGRNGPSGSRWTRGVIAIGGSYFPPYNFLNFPNFWVLLFKVALWWQNTRDTRFATLTICELTARGVQHMHSAKRPSPAPVPTALRLPQTETVPTEHALPLVTLPGPCHRRPLCLYGSDSNASLR